MAVNIPFVHITSRLMAMNISYPTIAGVLFGFEPFGWIMHPTHGDCPRRNAMIDADDVVDLFPLKIQHAAELGTSRVQKHLTIGFAADQTHW